MKSMVCLQFEQRSMLREILRRLGPATTATDEHQLKISKMTSANEFTSCDLRMNDVAEKGRLVSVTL